MKGRIVTREHPERDTIECVACAEEILAAAKKCKHCGHVRGTRLKPKRVMAGQCRCGGRYFSAKRWGVGSWVTFGASLLLFAAGFVFGPAALAVWLLAAIAMVLAPVVAERYQRCGSCGRAA